MVARETMEVARIAFGRRNKATSAVDEVSSEALNRLLASADLDDVVHMLEASGKHAHCLGPLTARLIELGEQITDQAQTYADAMRHQRKRLEQDPSARHDLAMHPRTYGRPAKQLTTDADAWVVPMVEDEIRQMSACDLGRLRQNVIMRVGRQHDIHPDFRPLLLRLAIDDRNLACLASIERGRFGGGSSKSYLLAAVAGPFIDVIMKDPDDGIDLEAAAWDFTQRQLQRAGASASANRLIQSAREASSLLALIDTSRTLATRESDAQIHAGLATRSAIAEFVLSNLILLSTNPKAALAKGHLEIGAFVRREFVGRSPIDIPDSVLEVWTTRRSARRLLLDLVLVTLLADHERHDLPPMPPFSDQDIDGQALRHLADIERRPLGRMAIQAISSGWHLGDWAGAA